MNGRGPLLAVILLLAHAVVTSQGAATGAAEVACMGSACTLQVSASLPPDRTLFLALNDLRYAAGAPPLCNSTVLRAVAREWLRNLWLAGLTPDCRNGSLGAVATAGLGTETPECYQAPLLPHVRKEYSRYTPFITSLYSLFGTSTKLSNLQSLLSSDTAGAADEAARAFVHSTFANLHSSSSSPAALTDYLLSDVGIYIMEGSGIQEESEPLEDETSSTSTGSVHGGNSSSSGGGGLSSPSKGVEVEKVGEHNWWVAMVVGQMGAGLQSFCEVRGQVVSLPGRAILV
ncbi:unnamed protein product [Closterium sp. NIES-64]|nr:unnamed protein product [Closterium sp. NIES-64]